MSDSSRMHPISRFLRIALAIAGLTIGAIAKGETLPSTIDLASAPSGFLRIDGDDAGDQIGGGSASNGIAFGDLNGDGFDDLIVGAPKAENGSAIDAGEVYIAYGGATFHDKTIDLNTDGDTALWKETRILGAAVSDWTGLAVACGDFNGDRFDDVLIGAPGLLAHYSVGAMAEARVPASMLAAPSVRLRTSYQPRERAGTTYIVYGSNELPGRTIDLDTGGALTPEGETRILGDDKSSLDHIDQFGDATGWALATADVNADGYDDAIVGALTASPLGREEAGVVYIIYGSLDLPARTIDLDTDGAISAAGETRIRGRAAGERAGYAVAAGDVDGDGIDDILIGAREAMASPAGAYAGSVFVVYGSRSLAASLIDLAGAGSHTHLRATRVDEWHGSAVACGDVDGDGFDDILLGAQYASPLGRSEAGEAYLVNGQAALRGLTVNLDAAGGGFPAPTRLLGGASGDHAAFSLACGDVNGNGLDDAILGAYNASSFGRQNNGKAYAILDSRVEPGATLDLAVDANLTVLGAATNDTFGGNCEAGGDLGGNGLGDFAASAPLGQHPDLGPGNYVGYAVSIQGAGQFSQARATERFAPGAAPPRGFGGRLSPSVRARLGFLGGSAPDAGPSAATIAMRRNTANISIEDSLRADSRLAGVVWFANTDRTSFACADLTLQYLDSEVTNLREDRLRLYGAPTNGGPWTLATPQVASPECNRIATRTGRLDGYFALVDSPAHMPASVDLAGAPVGVFLAYGDDVDDSFGGASNSNGIAMGDIDGDGLADLIVGAPGGDTPGGQSAGEVYVIYGASDLSATGLNLDTIDWSNQTTLTRLEGDAELGVAGAAVASGDINGDGYDDVIVGAPVIPATDDGRVGAGVVTVVYGGPALRGQSVGLGDSGNTRILGDYAGESGPPAKSGEALGTALASGDLNGDGYGDILIGAWLASPQGREEAGMVYALYGSAQIAGTRIDLATGGALSPAGETRIAGGAAGERAGYNVATGDLNGDGYDDVAIGARTASGESFDARAYVVYGSPALPASAVTLSASGAPPAANQTRLSGGRVDSHHGSAVAVGDLNGDGYDDILFGAQFASPEGRALAGEAYAVFGGPDLPGSALDLRDPAETYPGPRPARILGERAFDSLGFAMAAGDVSGDGIDDLILGAYLTDPFGRQSAGTAYVVFGRDDLPGTTQSLASPIARADVAVYAEASDDVFGGNLAAGGDLDGDGFGDLAVAAHRGRNPSIASDAARTGYVAALFGSSPQLRARAVEPAAPRRGFGGRLSPTLRAWLSLGAGEAAWTTASLVRGNADIANLKPEGEETLVAPVAWRIEASRETGGSATLRLRYTDEEVAGMSEEGLRLYRAPQCAGPWSLAESQTVDAARNTIQTRPLGLGYFALTSKRPPTRAAPGAWMLYE